MSAQIKVLFVIDSLGGGGAERSLVELLPRLIAANIEPVIVTLRSVDLGFEEEARSTGVRIMAIETGGFIRRVRALRELIKAEAPDLVHTTLFDSDIAGRLASVGIDVSVSTSLVNTSYDPVRYRDPNVTRWKLEAVRIVDGWTARHLCGRFHAISNAVKEASVSSLRIDSAAVTVVHRSRDLARLGAPSRGRRYLVRDSLGLAADQPVLLSVGRQEFQKGQSYLIEAMSSLTKTRNDLVLLVAGREGNATDALESMVQGLNLQDNVRILGHRSDIGDLLSAADVFVFPSLYEGLGGALLEAYSFGIAVIASDIAAIREVVGKHAVLIEPGDSKAIADGVVLLLEGMSGADREDIQMRGLPKGYDPDSVADGMVNFFVSASCSKSSKFFRVKGDS